MFTPTAMTWFLLVVGWLILVVMLAAQGLMVLHPESELAKKLMIAEGEEWRDETHFRSALGLAVADLLVWLPLLLIGSIGVALGQPWGWGIWTASGVIAVYASVLLWVLERRCVYPAVGPVAYYTYVWGIYLYWGLAVVAHALHNQISLS